MRLLLRRRRSRGGGFGEYTYTNYGRVELY
ncbi:hypothetical protein AK40_6210 (plasmid) [Bacillus cereus 03BB108]|uniref:Uncharacterized protein n=1 Tax=Bacillus cereus 03BB108 TaxID=451709 RepID=A0AAN0SQL4_BACCE|nr:hypothetical protein AK40_6210 [Bacillus cereus 03BB108]